MAKRKNKLTLITGASSGIGLALAERLSAEHDLVLVGRRPKQDVASQVVKKAEYIQIDMANPIAGVSKIFARLQELNVTFLDHLVQSAGVGFYIPPDEEVLANIEQIVSVNLLFPMLLTQKLAPMLEANQGRVSLIGSVAHKGSSNMASYAASKAGLNGLARSLSAEWRGRIDVQVIHPGPTLTPMLEKAGYKLGWERLLFLKPETMAAEIATLISSGKSPATVFMRAKLKSLVGLGK